MREAIIEKQHTSALHGYCIKDTAEILKAVLDMMKQRLIDGKIA